jgi:hypothetical protein
MRKSRRVTRLDFFAYKGDIVIEGARLGNCLLLMGLHADSIRRTETIAKSKNVGLELKEMIRNGNMKSVFEDLVEPVPCGRLELLADIMTEADLNDLDLLEEKIYQYGSWLGSKNELGRLLFVRMVFLLNNAKKYR